MQLARKQSLFKTISEYFVTVDHKKIGLLYLFSGLFFLVCGTVLALLMRIQLSVPENDFLSGQTYNEVMTMHGTTMIFFAATPLIFGLMNYIVPLQIGARDVAFPFINALGFWFFLFGGIFLYSSFLFGEVPDAGWTAYASLAVVSPGHGVDFYLLALQLSGAGTIMSGINFLVTIVNMRAPGMSYMRLPLFTWTSFITSALIIFAFPAFTIGLILLLFSRLFGAQYFNVAIGGNTVIYEHLFWIFGHPEVYILVLPIFGVFSEIFSTFSKKRLFGYTSMVFAVILIGFLGFMVWAHHMFTVGLGPFANAIFAIATMAIAVPTGIKIFNWLLTLWGGSIRLTTPMLYGLGFIPSFIIGGVTGVMTASAAADYQFHDSYFVVAHFHYVIVGGIVFGILGGLHYWWPKMFGYVLNETLGKISFAVLFVGFHTTFFVLHFVGLMGMPRRYFTYLKDQDFGDLNYISTIGSYILVLGLVLIVLNYIYSSITRVKANNDPWNGRTLEWSIPSPPPLYNFKQVPQVNSLDAFWYEKMEGNSNMSSLEELSDIHMPSNSSLPFFIAFGFFIASYGLMFLEKGSNNIAFITLVIGGIIAFGSMFLRSTIDDKGYYITKKQLSEEDPK
ncbi:MAG: cytochrome c oxidase subunit [Bacillales bacterium]|jgi:cytochrome c oxidase subunit 1|nr:cytochrome c oxidase subunit [Bacillales bacterium]